MKFSHTTRQSNIEHMKQVFFDFVVIGGGITGAAVARDAALRGFSVALVEKGDFGSGTSSKSARMVHGGFRYLEQYQFGLVMSACSERYKLLNIASPLVRPAQFIFPVYRGSKNGLGKINLGMWLYDLLAFFRNVRRHKVLSPEDTIFKEPALSCSSLDGAISYYDGLADDARLTLATIIAGQRAGAHIANYLEVQSVHKADGLVAGVGVRDHITGEEFNIQARTVINATGVWVDELRKIDQPNVDSIVRSNRGSHIVVSREKVPINDVIVFISSDDQRGMYIVPWGNTCVVGTTDVDHIEGFDDVGASRQEVLSMLDSVNETFPEARLEESDVISTFAGLRPLLGTDDGDAYSASRDHEIMESESGLISITGGKLTTHRKMAEDVMSYAMKKLSRNYGISPRSNTRSDCVPLFDNPSDPKALIASLVTERPDLDQDIIKHLVETYNSNANTVLGFIDNDTQMESRIHPDLPYIFAEIPYIIHYEMAMTLSDCLIRRTHIIHEVKTQGVEVAPEVAKHMAKYLDWDAFEVKRQIEEYVREVELSRSFQQSPTND